MIQIIQLKGKDKHLYRLLVPLVMDPNVIRANNNYAFKTDENYTWFIAVENRNVIGFIPIEHKGSKKAIINNYYIAMEGDAREEILSELLSTAVKASETEGWLLESVTLTPDKEIFEKFDFSSLDKKWTRYVKMRR